MFVVGYICSMRFSSRVEQILVGWFVGMLCAVLMALGALGAINRWVYDPAGQVRQYFQAIRDGNGSRALGILGAEVPEGADGAMLNGDVLKRSLANLKDLTVDSTHISADGTEATVTVDYTLDGEPATTDFELEKVGSHWGVFDQWHIKKGELPTVTIDSVAVDAATLNNAKVHVGEGAQKYAVMYPGEFTVTYESNLFSSQPETARITSAEGEAKPLDVKLQPSEQAMKSVNYQIKSQLDSCATQDTLYPAGCPFEYPFTGRVQGDVKWSIEKYPQPELDYTSDKKWNLAQSSGVARISFTQLDLLTGETSQVNESVPFIYNAQLNVSGEELALIPDTSDSTE